MFALLLAIIISSSLSKSAVADPSPQSHLGFGMNGAGYQTYYPYYGYGTHYYGTPHNSPMFSSFGNNQGFGGYPHDIYMPGRMNPFTYPYQNTRLSGSAKGSYISGFKSANSPHSLVFENYYNSRNQVMPHLEGFKPYVYFRSARSSQKSSNNTSFEESSDEVSARIARDQMTYLGYMPSLNTRRDSQETKNQPSGGVHINFMPFSPLRLDTIIANESESPYRMENDKLRQLRQSFSNYQQTSFDYIRPLVPVRPLPTITHNPMIKFGSRHHTVSPYLKTYANPSTETHLPTTTQFSSAVSTPTVLPYRLNTPVQLLGSPLRSALNPAGYSRNQALRTQNRYYMLDNQPLKTISQGYSNLKMTGPDYIQQAHKFFKLPQEIYNSGLKTVIPFTRTFSNSFLDRLLLIPQNNHQTQHSFNSGQHFNFNPYGPTGLSL